MALLTAPPPMKRAVAAISPLLIGISIVSIKDCTPSDILIVEFDPDPDLLIDGPDLLVVNSDLLVVDSNLLVIDYNLLVFDSETLVFDSTSETLLVFDSKISSTEPVAGSSNRGIFHIITILNKRTNKRE